MKFKFFMAILALVAAYAPELAFANGQGATNPANHSGSGAGSSLRSDIEAVFTGDIGFLVGLGISVFGLYMWLIKQASWGLVMLIAGGLITVFPSLFSSIESGSQSAFSETIK